VFHPIFLVGFGHFLAGDCSEEPGLKDCEAQESGKNEDASDAFQHGFHENWMTDLLRFGLLLV
jgi:hypothetical protein